MIKVSDGEGEGMEARDGDGVRDRDILGTTEIIIPVFCHPISLFLFRDESRPSVQLLAWGSMRG